MHSDTVKVLFTNQENSTIKQNYQVPENVLQMWQTSKIYWIEMKKYKLHKQIDFYFNLLN